MHLFRFLFSLLAILLYFLPNAASAQDVNIDEEKLLQWVQGAAIDIASFAFYEVEDDKLNNQQYFTKQGWTSYQNAVEKSGIIDMVMKQQGVYEASSVCFPHVASFNEHEKSWTINLTAKLEYFTPTRPDHKSTKYQEISLGVEYDKSVDNELKVGIARWLSIGVDEEVAQQCDEAGRVKAKIGGLKREIKFHEKRIELLKGKIEALENE